MILGSLVASAARGAAFPAVLRIPRLDPGVPYPPRTLFSHREHETLGCYACHPSIFPQQALIGFTHQQMSEGKFCGRCHDGRTAFGIPGTPCARCHADAH